MESLKIFKQIEQKKKDEMNLGKKNGFSQIKINKNFSFHHNKEILNYFSIDKGPSAKVNQNFGISFITPQYVQFHRFSKRLNDQILAEKTYFNLKVKS